MLCCSPAHGPYAGGGSAVPPPADAPTIEKFQEILRGRYGIAAGTAGAVANDNPAVNMFARLDLSLPSWRSRLVLRHNLARGHEDVFERTPELFPLSSGAYTQIGHADVTAVQFFTALGGADNELLAGYYTGPFYAVPNARSPTVRL